MDLSTLNTEALREQVTARLRREGYTEADLDWLFRYGWRPDPVDTTWVTTELIGY